jgi:hypothetical protein
MIANRFGFVEMCDISVNFTKYNRFADRGGLPDKFSRLSDRDRMHHACPAAIFFPMAPAIGHSQNFWRFFCMKFLSNHYKKYIAAAATAFAAIAIPAEATDCVTYCQSVASQAGNAAAQQKQQEVQAYCIANSSPNYINQCINAKVPEIQAAYDQAYQQSYNQCMTSCH